MSGLEGLLLGRVLGGRYRIEEVIGRGGMGAVYRSTDERLGRKVAVKVITVAMGDDPETRRRVRARFQREARAAAALPHHPNVVPVYDYGTDEELGLDYIVMELLQGHDLATRLQRSGAPPLAIALQILREAARGLAVGHRAGLVHRDVKPGNIFLARDHDELQVRMVDFGIAKLADDEDTANQLTQDGRIPHSPAYASPEQLRGLTQLTPASDVFSLGAVGFQLLTGERPYTDADRNRMSLGMPVPAPSLRSRNPAIPTAIEEIVQKALAFDATDRFPDAMAMANAVDRAVRELPDAPIEPYLPMPIGTLEAHDDDARASRATDDDDRTQLMDVGAAPPEDERTQLMDLPVAAPPATPPPAGPRRPPFAAPPPKKRRTALWVWIFVLLGLGAATAAIVNQANQGRSLADQFPASDTLPVDTAPAAADTVPPPPDVAAINEQGTRLFAQGRLDEALTLFERAVRLDPGNAEYRQNVGITLFRLGRIDAARAALAEAVQRNPGLDRAYAVLAQTHLQQNDTTSAIAALEQVVSRTGDARLRAQARTQLNALRIERQLLGEPVDTAPAPVATPSATPRPTPPDTAQ